MRPARPLRIVVVAPEIPAPDLADAQTDGEIERSRSLRIGLLENGYNVVATLPARSRPMVVAPNRKISGWCRFTRSVTPLVKGSLR